MQNKTLYKTSYNKMIFGVCNGLAEYLNLDVSIIRIIFVIVGFSGMGVLAYIICALILPEKI